MTYSLCLFLGPGLARALGMPSGPTPFAAAADRLMPFFLIPSVGGPIAGGAGVPLPAGVGGFESEALSPFDAGAPWSVADVAGES